MTISKNTKNYQTLLSQISDIYAKRQNNAYQAVNQQLINSYWQIGKYIVEFERGGEERAGYVRALVENLAKDLGIKYGIGFSRSNLIYMRLFFL